MLFHFVCLFYKDSCKFFAVGSRAVEPEPKQFWMAGAGAKNFYMEPEPEIWVPVPQIYFVAQASYTNNTSFFSDFLDQIVLEPGPKTSRCWSRSQKNLVPRAGD